MTSGQVRASRADGLPRRPGALLDAVRPMIGAALQACRHLVAVPRRPRTASPPHTREAWALRADALARDVREARGLVERRAPVADRPPVRRFRDASPLTSRHKALALLRKRGFIAWTGVVWLALASGLVAYRWAEQAGYSRLADMAVHQLDLYAAGLESELGKYESLPGVLEQNEDVVALLDHPDSASMRDKVNRNLLNLNVRVGTLGIVLVDARGVAIASSNWYRPTSVVSEDLSSSAFFTDAVRSGQSRSFVVGASRGAPECFLARAVMRRDQVIGVVAIRISLESIESTWIEYAASSQSEKVLVIDEHGIVIMSSNPAWRYKALLPLTPEKREALTKSNRYPAGSLEPLRLSVVRNTDFGTQLVRVADSAAPSGTTEFFAEKQDMERPGWHLMTLFQVAPILEEARHAAFGGVSLGALVALIALYLLQRRRANLQRLHARAELQRAYDLLEQRVEERTRELRGANHALVSEVAERRRTEESLRTAQDELVEASRLALLGKMSAAITHEINQPLTALRAMSDNGMRLLAAGRLPDVEDKFRSIAQVTERIGRITTQLKSFARKPPSHPGAVRLGAAVANAMELLRPRIQAEGVELEIDVPGCARIACEGHRLEQVLLNLFGNALDAMKDAPVRRLVVKAVVEGGRVLLRIEDTGAGLPDSVMARLFEPFFTTKPPGEGLGLGLVLSSGIVREFGGTLRAFNLERGAAFEFDMKLESEEAHA